VRAIAESQVSHSWPGVTGGRTFWRDGGGVDHPISAEVKTVLAFGEGAAKDASLEGYTPADPSNFGFSADVFIRDTTATNQTAAIILEGNWRVKGRMPWQPPRPQPARVPIPAEWAIDSGTMRPEQLQRPGRGRLGWTRPQAT
jgi:hypothetical protein